MIEIVCPNCQARYQLPDGAIGAEGRKVSCSSCSHKWRAHAEVTPSPAASGPSGSATPAVSRERSPEEAMAAMSTATEMSDTAPVSPIDSPPPAAGNRDEQMAAIRQMLSDLKEAADSSPEIAEAAPAKPEKPPAPPGPSARRRSDDDDGDSLQNRIEDVSTLARMVKGEPTGSGYDAIKLRKRHEKRAKRMQRLRERRKKSGAFLTGVTLVVVVSGTMTGLYVMHPQLIAAAPQMEPALTEYVTTVDRYRVELDKTTQDWKAWLMERIGKLTNKDSSQ